MTKKTDILDAVWERRPDVPLYHYTTQSGVLGIVSKFEIWATHTQYLNDHREVKHALDMASEEIEVQKKKNSAYAHLLDQMQSGLEGVEDANVCVCSFSEDSDSLSQWRAYGAKASGYALGFSPEALARVTEKSSSWRLAKCIYEEEEQRKLIAALVAKVLKENIAAQGRKEPDNTDLMIGGNISTYLHRYAPIIKHSSFRDEKEWRLISRPRSSKSARYDFREGPSMLIPYYKIPMGDQQSGIGLSRVVVGPTPHPEKSRRSLRSLLSRYGNKRTITAVSVVPYRSW